MDSSEYILGKNWRDLIPIIKVEHKQVLIWTTARL